MRGRACPRTPSPDCANKHHPIRPRHIFSRDRPLRVSGSLLWLMGCRGSTEHQEHSSPANNVWALGPRTSFRRNLEAFLCRESNAVAYKESKKEILNFFCTIFSFQEQMGFLLVEILRDRLQKECLSCEVYPFPSHRKERLQNWHGHGRQSERKKI